MTIKFNREDALTCCSCFIEKPSFRLISLELVPGKDGGLVSTCMSTLLCNECLKPELDDFHRSLEQNEIPLGQGETEDEFLYLQIGVLVVPISLSYEEARLLASEIADRRARMCCELALRRELGLWRLHSGAQLGRALDS